MTVGGRRQRARRLMVGSAVIGATLGLALTATLVEGAAPAGAAQYESLQWGLSVIAAQSAWPYGTGAGVKVGIVDTGVDTTQQDLQGKVVAATTFLSDPSSGCDTAQQDPDGEDDEGHGTHVAGIAAASGRYGVTGVAPGASLVVAKVLDCTGSGQYSDVVSGIDWAVQQGAKVINLSLGDAAIEGLVDTSNIEGSPLGQALQNAWNNGVIPVIAAGNNSNGLLGLGDADYAGVPAIVVAATGSPRNGETDELASYSNAVNEAQWGLAAPGGDDPSGATTPSCGADNPYDPYEILSTYWTSSNPTTCYATDEGTSMATPFVTGAAALLLGRGLRPTQVVQTLLGTADHDVACGSDCSGLLDAGAAMQAAVAMAPGTTPTAPAKSAPTTSATARNASSEPGRASDPGDIPASTSSTGPTASTPPSAVPTSKLRAAAVSRPEGAPGGGAGGWWWVALPAFLGAAGAGALGHKARRRRLAGAGRWAQGGPGTEVPPGVDGH